MVCVMFCSSAFAGVSLSEICFSLSLIISDKLLSSDFLSSDSASSFARFDFTDSNFSSSLSISLVNSSTRCNLFCSSETRLLPATNFSFKLFSSFKSC